MHSVDLREANLPPPRGRRVLPRDPLGLWCGPGYRIPAVEN